MRPPYYMVVDRINKPSHSTHEREGYFWGAVLNPLHPCGWSPRLKEYPLGLPEFQSTPPLRVETIMWTRRRCLSANFNPHHPCGWRPVYARCFCIGYEFQSTPPLWVETANLYSDTQYFPYRFGEIHNFALSPPTFLSSQSTKTALWAIFLARSSRKFYDCLGFAPSSTYSIISPGWQSRYLHRLSMVLVSI